MSKKDRGSYSNKDAAKDTDCSTKSVSRAWHQARDDAAASGQLDERNEHKTSDSPEGSILGGIFRSLGFGKGDGYSGGDD